MFSNIRIDIVATADVGIGPTNRWYKQAVAEAISHELAPDLKVLVITPIYFIATKLEAFRGRGHGDYQASHDLEDILLVLAGLPDLRAQLQRECTPVAATPR